MSMAELQIRAGKDHPVEQAPPEESWMVVVKAGKTKQVFMSPTRAQAAQGLANMVETAAAEKTNNLPGFLSITLYQGVVEDTEWKSDMKPQFKVDLRIYRS